MAESLLEKETLNQEDIEKIFNVNPILIFKKYKIRSILDDSWKPR